MLDLEVCYSGYFVRWVQPGNWIEYHRDEVDYFEWFEMSGRIDHFGLVNCSVWEHHLDVANYLAPCEVIEVALVFGSK